jgi:hypothetical protein
MAGAVLPGIKSHSPFAPFLDIRLSQFTRRVMLDWVKNNFFLDAEMPNASSENFFAMPL